MISLIDICSDKQTLLLEFVCISDLKLNLLMSFLAFLSEEKKHLKISSKNFKFMQSIFQVIPFSNALNKESHTHIWGKCPLVLLVVVDFFFFFLPFPYIYFFFHLQTMEKSDDQWFLCIFFRQHTTISFTNNRFSPSNNRFLFFQVLSVRLCIIYSVKHNFFFVFFRGGCNRVEVRVESWLFERSNYKHTHDIALRFQL